MCDHRNKVLAVLLSGKCWVRLTQTHLSLWVKSVNSSCSSCIHTVGAQATTLDCFSNICRLWIAKYQRDFPVFFTFTYIALVTSKHLCSAFTTAHKQNTDVVTFVWYVRVETILHMQSPLTEPYRCGHPWMMHYVRVETILHMQSPSTELYRCGHLWLIYYVHVETILHMWSPLTELYRCSHLWLIYRSMLRQSHLDHHRGIQHRHMSTTRNSPSGMHTKYPVAKGRIFPFFPSFVLQLFSLHILVPCPVWLC